MFHHVDMVILPNVGIGRTSSSYNRVLLRTYPCSVPRLLRNLGTWLVGFSGPRSTKGLTDVWQMLMRILETSLVRMMSSFFRESWFNLHSVSPKGEGYYESKYYYEYYDNL